MTLERPVALPQDAGLLGCRICGCKLGSQEDFSRHHKAPWHLYNMRRRSQQLEAVSFDEFQQKLRLLQLARQFARGELSANQGICCSGEDSGGLSSAAVNAFHEAVRCNKRGTAHLKQQQQRQQQGSSAEAAAAAKVAAAAWRAALHKCPERCNLFEQMPPFPSAADCLKYMKSTYGFFLPEEEYCTSPAGVLRCLWRQQLAQPQCLFCSKRFRGVRAALQHMRDQRHFQLQWGEEQQDALSKFYDFRQSYYQLMERLSGSHPRTLTPADADSDAQGAATPPTEEAAQDEWEDCSSDEGDDDEATEQGRLDAMLRSKGWSCARVTESGMLQLPSGLEVPHRAFAVYCRQRLRRGEPHRAALCVLQDLAGVSPSLGDANNSRTSVLLRKRQKLLRHNNELRGGVLVLRQQHRLLLPQQQRRLIMRRETEQHRKMQQRLMTVGIKANKLQRTVLRETKCFL